MCPKCPQHCIIFLPHVLHFDFLFKGPSRSSLREFSTLQKTPFCTVRFPEYFTSTTLCLRISSAWSISKLTPLIISSLNDKCSIFLKSVAIFIRTCQSRDVWGAVRWVSECNWDKMWKFILEWYTLIGGCGKKWKWDDLWDDCPFWHLMVCPCC